MRVPKESPDEKSHGGVIQGLSAALWELILLGAKLAIDPRPIGRQ
jgi:hypothetical protein